MFSSWGLTVLQSLIKLSTSFKFQDLNNPVVLQWLLREETSPAVAVIQDFEYLLVRSACCWLDIGQKSCNCEQADVCILRGTKGRAQADWGGRGGRGYTGREVNGEKQQRQKIVFKPTSSEKRIGKKSSALIGISAYLKSPLLIWLLWRLDMFSLALRSLRGREWKWTYKGYEDLKFCSVHI